jgi:hypothetical protein
MCQRRLSKQDLIELPDGHSFSLKIASEDGFNTDLVVATKIAMDDGWLEFDIPEHGEDGEGLTQLVELINDDGSWDCTYADGTGIPYELEP